MEYKLLAADMDGTLLDEASCITPRTRKALLAAMEKGVLFVPSTGRPLCGMDMLRGLLPADMPYILLNGALAMTCESRRLLFSQPLPFALAQEIYSQGRALELPVTLWTEDMLFVSHDCPAVRDYQRITGAQLHLMEEMDVHARRNICKMLWIAPEEQAAVLQQKMQRLFGGSVNCHTSRPYLLEFVDAKASKGLALEAVGAAYGIDRSEMIAVGDGWNDISMLDYAGLGVAMGNAPKEIRSFCDAVTLSNREDGVAAVIEKYILGGSI